MPSPTNTTYTTESTGSQDGRQVAGAWVDEASPFLSSSFDSFVLHDLYAGFQWQLYPPGNLNAPRRILNYATVGLTVNSNVVGPITLQVLGLMTQTVLVPFSNANLPSAAPQVVPYSRLNASSAWAQAGFFDYGVLPDGGLVTFDVDLMGLANTTAYNWMVSTHAPAHWTGAIGLYVHVQAVGGAFDSFSLVAAEDPTLAAPAITLTELAFHTGFRSARRDRTRAGLDGRLGFPIHSADAIEDGFRDGLYVQSWDWDPDDPFEDTQYVPSPYEGGTDGKPV